MDNINLKFILDTVNGENAITNSNDDRIFRTNTKEQITLRDSKYTELLTHFINVTRTRNILKEIFKWMFLFSIIFSMVVLVHVVLKLFNKYFSVAEVEQIIQSIPLLTTAMVGFVSTIITIPVTITKYLFNTEEDKNITSIIKHTQKHDVSGRAWATEYKKLVENNLSVQNVKSQPNIPSYDEENVG